MGTDVVKVACCQPAADSLVTVPVASAVPAEFHRVTVWVPTLAAPL